MKIYFHLVEGPNDSEFPFAFLATYVESTGNKCSKQSKHRKHRALKYSRIQYRHDSHGLYELMFPIIQGAKKSDFIAHLFESGNIFYPLAWGANEAYQFLQDIPIFEEAGIICRIPNWWKKAPDRPKLHITVGTRPPTLFGPESVVDFKVHLMVGDTPLSRQQIRKILAASEGLAYIKGKWIKVDKGRLKQSLSSWEQAQKLMQESGMPLSEALRLLMIPGSSSEKFKEATLGGQKINMTCGAWLKSILTKLQNPNLIKSTQPAKEFKAHLRPYQQRGLDWLFLLHSLNLGACLADDMGLGKTIQVLAFLQTLTKLHKNLPASLLVLPATLIANWVFEIKRFAPALKIFIAHPSSTPHSKLKSMNDLQMIDSFDLIITTYGLVKRYGWLQKYNWSYVILDEAQAIKNPATAQTKAVKKLKSNNRLILTGTPIENRLSDLWSLFDFLNPGLLGNKREFTELNRAIDEGEKSYRSLQSVIGPYILRRLKTDRSIISDLPKKIELDTYSTLTKTQEVLYQQLVKKLEVAIKDACAMKKRGLVLASLIKFKQICNHPDQYLGQGIYAESESGKFMRLRQLCETIREKKEQVLIFTQFKEVTGPLSRFLTTIFKKEGAVLHGATPINRRKKLVEKFQSDEYVPYFILSVKAGGLGLNLTAANHVIHFDRWWNPAVENQATDRAFRIGQNKSVVVHKFITQGSIEEKIAIMIDQKKQLAFDVIGKSGAQWITEMSNEEVINLFRMQQAQA
ncbi:MAG: DEAD/DEAH box helicase [Bacteriovoracaceae bacterium]|nr:DEAD/DEAH box helicase [Bacteriovoracaceae bacterium]